jgi:hypothetical protein
MNALQSNNSSDRGLFYDSVVFSDLQTIDKNILYRDFEQKASPFTYVMKIVDLNRERLQKQYGLKALFIDYESSAFHVRGPVRHLVTHAVQRVVGMLKEPVFTLRVNPDFVVVLRILKDVKKDFSSATGCWLHFIWVSRTVACYGMDGNTASEYVQHIIQCVRRCAANPLTGYNGFFVTERQYDRKYKNLIKKHVDYLENKTGSKVAIKKDDVASGALVVQFYGHNNDIQEAYRVLDSEILCHYVDETEPQSQFFGNSSATTGTSNILLNQLGQLQSLAKNATFHVAATDILGGNRMGNHSDSQLPNEMSPVSLQSLSLNGADNNKMLHLSGNQFALAFSGNDTSHSMNTGFDGSVLTKLNRGQQPETWIGESNQTRIEQCVDNDDQNAMLMHRVFDLVEKSGDTKWVIGLLKFINEVRIDLGELIRYMQERLERSSPPNPTENS